MNGLDVSFIQGLNVVVGPRGAGKTTLLELIRHAIGAEHADKSRERSRKELLAAVLGSGEVVLDLQDDEGASQIVVDAKGRGRRPELSQSVLVLGQSELEDIASDAASRLKLLDLRAGGSSAEPDRSLIGQLTRKVFDLRKVLETLSEETSKRSGLEADREIYRSQEAALVGESSSPLAAQRDSLKVTEEKANTLTRTLEALARVGKANVRFQSSVTQASDLAADVASLSVEVPDLSVEVLPRMAQVQDLLNSVLELSNEVELSLGIRSDLSVAEEKHLKEIAVPLRANLDEAEAGLGQLTAQIRNVNAQLLELDAVDARIASIQRELQSLIAGREQEYSHIESAEETLFQARLEVAAETSHQIDSHIVVVVQHLSDTREFRAVLLDSLKGTHTRAALIDSLAARILPRLLLELVELNDVDGLASVGDLTLEQSARVIGALDSPDYLSRLSEVALRDNVDFLLRDGAVDKSVDTLSTGQKCAVTLPIVLAERHRTLILDQPEDHLDNAYLVDHVVTGMTRRTAQSVQTIVATHNANIPVLGSAGRVFVLASDGQHGHVSEQGQFDQSDIVNAITSLMEGGRDAFARRSEFYEKHGSLL